MKKLLILLIISISVFPLFSQELVFCEDGQTKTFSNFSTTEVQVGFNQFLYPEEIDKFIDDINLNIFQYKNDVLIINKFTGNRKYPKSTYAVLKLSKTTSKKGVKDLIYTLKQSGLVSYAYPYYYNSENSNDRFALNNEIYANIKRGNHFDILEGLSEMYNFYYEYSGYMSNKIKIVLLPEATVEVCELTCILSKIQIFNNVYPAKMSIIKRSW